MSTVTFNVTDVSSLNTDTPETETQLRGGKWGVEKRPARRGLFLQAEQSCVHTLGQPEIGCLWLVGLLSCSFLWGWGKGGVLPLFYLCSANKILFPFTRKSPFWIVQGVTKALVHFTAFIVSNRAFGLWETAFIVTSRLSYTQVCFPQKPGLLQIALVRIFLCMYWWVKGRVLWRQLWHVNVNCV